MSPGDASATPVVRFENLRVGFRSPRGVNYVFRGLDLTIRPGELVCLVGPSGAGKSVLLNLLIDALGRNAPGLVLEGRREVFGRNLDQGLPPSLLKRLGIVFQEGALFEDLTVRENVAFGLNRGFPVRRGVKARVDALLEAVGLSDPPRRVGDLSGGQRKRLALARTLATEPEFLIFDEPTTGLDPALCLQIARLIRETHDAGVRGRDGKAGPRTTLVVTHDYQAVVPVADRVVILDPASGTLKPLDPERDPDACLAAMTGKRPGPVSAPGPGPVILGLRGLGSWSERWIGPYLRFLSRPVPDRLGQLGRRFADALVLPALYACTAGAVLGGLSTFFALENNPLKGAMDRQALIGLGKVLFAIVVPIITAILFAARVGAGAAARLGNIRLSRQDDALRMLGADPDRYLLTPLFWSCILGLPLLAFPVGVSAALSSMLCAVVTRPITPFGWAVASFDTVNLGDLVFGFVKLVGSGALVAGASASLGLKRKSGSEDLGRDVTAVIVASTLLVIMWHGLLTFIQYG